MAIRIMVPLDGSRLSETAVPYACDLAQHAGGVVRLVRVHTPSEQQFGDANYTTCIESEHARHAVEREYLAEFARDMEYGRFIEAAHLLGGNPAQSLNDYINNEDIDVVVMATHGRAGLSRAISGSVADALVRLARVPVVMLRADDESFEYPLRHHFGHIVVPVDGTRNSEAMIDVAISLFGTTPRFTLIEVMSPQPPMGFADSVPIPATFNQDELRKEVETHLQEFVSSLRARGLDIDYVVAEQPNVANAVCEYATREHVDVIAMVTSGRAGWKRLLVGSVGAELIHKAPVPLMLLKHRAADRVSLANAE